MIDGRHLRVALPYGRGQYNPDNLRHAVADRENCVVPGLRSFIGTILIIVLVIVYALAATTVATLVLGMAPWWVHALYFAISGLLWVLPAMLIIKWMAGRRPGP